MSEIKVNSVVNSTGDNDSGLDLSTNDQVIIKTANTTAVTVDSSQNTTLAGTLTGTSATLTTADNTAQLTLKSTDADANSGPLLDMKRDSSSPSADDFLGQVNFIAENNASEETTYAQITGRIEDVTDGAEDGRLTLKTMRAGSSRSAIDCRIDSITINDDGDDVDFRVESDTKSHAFFMRGSDGNILINTDTDRDPPSHVTIEFEGGSYSALACQFTDNASGSGFFVCRKADGATIGQIARNGTADSVQYLTTSDYRLKQNVSYDFNATSQLKQLRPCTFTWINDESNVTHQGFLAHEVQTILPYAVNGEKDAVDEEGKIEAQSIDKGDLVPLLVKTIQELEARITALENAE